MLRIALLIVLLLAPNAAQAGWLTRVLGSAEHGAARVARKGAALDHVAAYVKALPDRPDGIALAAQATQEGHWRFVNKAGETFTAGTPEELKRAASLLLPEAKADAKLSLYVTQDTVFQNRGALKELPKATDLFLVVGEESYRILKRAEGAGERLFAEVRPSLFLELAERARFEEALWQLMRPLDRAKVRVLALEPGGPSTITSTPRMDAATNRAVVDVIDPASLSAALGSIRGQTVLLTGRVDGQLLYVKPSSGPERSLLVRDLLQAAEDADVKGLDEALQRPRVADFLNALAGSGRRFTVTASPSGALRTSLEAHTAPDLPGGPMIKPMGDIFSELVADVAGHVVTNTVQANLRNAERQQELDQRIVPGIPSDIQFAYLGLLLLSLMGLPVVRAWWHRIWPPEQGAEYASRSGYWAARLIRGAVFLFVFLPLAALPAVPVHMASGLWQLVTTPVRWWRWLTRRHVSASAG
jgi:hypothetical protein